MTDGKGSLESLPPSAIGRAAALVVSRDLSSFREPTREMSADPRQNETGIPEVLGGRGPHRTDGQHRE
jgi:hypothetical protein